MTPVKVWRWEARRCGVASLGLPWLAAAGIAVVSFAAVRAHTASDEVVGLGMIRLVGLAFPITAGIATVAVVGRERMTELQSSFATAYPRTVLRRIVIVTAATTLAAALMIVVLMAEGLWSHPARGTAAILVPLGPALLFIGAGAWATARSRSLSAASVFVLCVWFLQIFFLDRFIGVWQVNRALLLLIGVALVAAALHRLGQSEPLIHGNQE